MALKTEKEFMRIIKRTVSSILLLALVLALFPGFSAKAGFSTYAEYVEKYKEFMSDSRWTPGVYWRDGRLPKYSKYKAYGCAALASDFEYYVYGTYGWKGQLYSSPSEIAPGDIVKFSSPHWFVVLERSGETLYTLEKHKDMVYVSDSHYRVHEGRLQIYGYYTKSGSWINGWHNLSFSKGYHFLDFEEQGIDVNWGDHPDGNDIGETDALLSARGELYGAAAKDIALAGITLYGADGEPIASYEEEPGFIGSDKNILSRYEVSSKLGVELTPDTAYKYSVYYVIAGERFTSPLKEFTTEEYVAELKETAAPKLLKGDLNRDAQITSDDAVYLLRYTLFPDVYPVFEATDYDSDGRVSSNDAIYLLWHTLYPNKYKISNK